MGRSNKINSPRKATPATNQGEPGGKDKGGTWEDGQPHLRESLHRNNSFRVIRQSGPLFLLFNFRLYTFYHTAKRRISKGGKKLKKNDGKAGLPFPAFRLIANQEPFGAVAFQLYGRLTVHKYHYTEKRRSCKRRTLE